MKQYPAYKDSGIEWLGEIPKHWVMGRLKYYNLLIMGQSPNSADYSDDKNLQPFLQGNAEFGKTNPKAKIYCDSANKSAIKGDILISVRAPVGALNIADRNYGIGRGLAAIRSESRNPYNLFFLVNANKYLNSISTGSTFTAVSIDDVRNIPYPEIPLTEQTQIATFLNHKTKKIDDLIVKKEKLIELLKEERTAIINQAVTKGIDPNVTMKDSGIEWLGEIPVEWELRKLSRSFKIIGSGTTPKSGEPKYYENGKFPWVLTGDLNNGVLEETSKKITQEALNDYSTLKFYPKGSIVLAMYGATIGKLSILGIEATTNQACCVISESEYFKNRFLYYWLIAKKEDIINLSYGGGQPNISQEIVRFLKIPCPSIMDQNEIIVYLNSKTLQIDNYMEKISNEIDLIKEYKTSLINEAVTGKIDVRDYSE